MVVKKHVLVIMSFKAQNNKKLIEGKRLSKCDVMLFNEHICILNYKTKNGMIFKILKACCIKI